MKASTFIKLAVSTAVITASAQAASISGSITIGSNGSGISVNTTSDTVTFGLAPNSQVSGSTGSYAGAGFVFATPVNYSSFSYGSPFAAIDPLWTSQVGGVNASFSLMGISLVSEGPSNFLNLQGYGTAYLTGFDATPGSWEFTSIGNQSTFAWTSTVDAPIASSVPDGGSTLAILGLSILGLGGARRMIFRSKK
jgi:hypothetical protein